MTTSETGRLTAWANQQGQNTASLIGRALDMARQAHHGELRKSGDPYIEHPVAVALILVENHANPETVAVALLHDVPTSLAIQPAAEIRSLFGHAVGDILDDFLDLDRTGYIADRATGKYAAQVKVADRLHNMRTIQHLEPGKQRRKADQTIHAVAPLARSIGLTGIGAELETLATATLRSTTVTERAAEQLEGPSRKAVARASRATLKAGSIVLPAHCRERWIQDWYGELHALTSRQQRVIFVINVLLGLPTMAVLTRRQEFR